jgi:glycosyltransferase involved in cell wall biosynthesis
LETLSIVIPVFNEVHTLKEIIERVREVHLPQVASREIVIVDDYSTDGTQDILATDKNQTLSKPSFTTGTAVREPPKGREQHKQREAS